MAAPLRLVFAGTPEFAVPCFTACLDSGAELVGVMTQPDRRAGRGRNWLASPVKQAAQAAAVPITQPTTLKNSQAREQLIAWQPDLMVVVAYGQILPRKVLAIPRIGCWNVHASLLPRWRGAAPIQRAIAAGDQETGVCLMQMQAGLDTGPVLLERRTPIHADDNAGSLHDRLAALAADVLRDGLERLRGGLPLPHTAQPDEGVSYAHKLEKAEAILDFRQSAAQLDRMIRAFDPWPVAEATLAGERLRIYRAEVLATQHQAEPGSVLHAGPDGLDVACGQGALRLLEVQRAGGRRMAIADYLNARPDVRDARG